MNDFEKVKADIKARLIDARDACTMSASPRPTTIVPVLRVHQQAAVTIEALSMDLFARQTKLDAANETIALARADIDRLRGELDSACTLIAGMHAAAVGEMRGPDVGPVEDVAALRAVYVGALVQIADLKNENRKLKRGRK